MNEQELIQGLRNGDETAFKLLVDTYQDRIFNTAIGTFKMQLTQPGVSRNHYYTRKKYC